MSSKTLIWIGMGVGGTIGGLLPYLWGASYLSFSSVILTGVGGLVGIWAGYKLGNL